MGKKRHSKDRMFITMTEQKYEWGGKKDAAKVPIAKLPFDCCSLSLLPFESPVCTKDGTIFDIVNIVPFIKKFKKNPVTGEPLKLSDLIKLNFYKNPKGEYHDPVTNKVFTDNTNIVAIATTGNVYAKETVDELNRQPKNWKDLLTDEAFTVKDIITLQDPASLRNRQVQEFHYIKEDIDVSTCKYSNEEAKCIVKHEEKDPSKFINMNSIGKRVLAELDDKLGKEEKKEPELQKKVKTEGEKTSEADVYTPAGFVKRKLESKVMKHDRFTSGQVATSFTSTSVDVATDNSTRQMTPNEIRKIYHDIVKSKQLKGYVQMITNYGTLNLMIHCDHTPLTGENFIELCEKKYFNDTKFHRLVRNFCLQGGDPTGTGKGGESFFGQPFEDEFHEKLSHDKLGMMSMANSGVKTNRSQFFFTLRPCKHLDQKHSVFGEVIEGHGVLETINKQEADWNEKPVKDIKIIDTIVLTNPYREAIKTIMDKEKKEKESENKKIEEEKRKDERWLSTKDTQLIFTSKPVVKPQQNLVSSIFAPEEGEKKKRTNFDFSGW